MRRLRFALIALPVLVCGAERARAGEGAAVEYAEFGGGAPSVNIAASPLHGVSPLSVQFNGNAVSDLAIDPSRTAWDFDTGDNSFTDATTPLASHTYLADPGETKTFTARLTMYDVAGIPGFAEVQIQVVGPEPPSGSTLNETPGLRISVNSSSANEPDLASGVSPFEVELRIVSDTIGTIVQSVSWDLGDGTRTSSLSVLHTYINTSAENRNFVAVASVNLRISNGSTVSETVSRVITVMPGTDIGETIDGKLPGTTPYGDGGAAGPCGVLGLIPMLFSLASLMWLRRRT